MVVMFCGFYVIGCFILGDRQFININEIYKKVKKKAIPVTRCEDP
jgi:hypothetical protein